MSDNNHAIRTHACPECYLCGARGNELYGGLTDRLFGAPGVWNLKQCPDAGCGLTWLDPMPVEEDIALAYRSYYTHQSDDAGKGMAALAYRILWGVLARATGLIKEKRAIWDRYLGDQSSGRLLEIGCGAGNYLARMRTLGWTVEGVEIDPAACRHARKINGLTVHQGNLESKGYPNDCFDAIVINHVIEHVFDPVNLLRECRRIVKPGGKVILLTPNTKSWGHRTFKEYWIGLDPPRHVLLFSSKAMGKCAGLAGFEKTEISTSPANAEFFIKGSMGIKDDGQFDMMGAKAGHSNYIQGLGRTAKYYRYALHEYFQWKSDPEIGEELVMICQK